jgi:hypothetical protein
MKRLALLLMASFAIAVPAEAACTPKHRCHKTLTATSTLRTWTTPTIPANASVEIHLWVRGKRLPEGGDGLYAFFAGRGVFALAAFKEQAAPGVINYVAKRKTRVRVAYWF